MSCGVFYYFVWFFGLVASFSLVFLSCKGAPVVLISLGGGVFVFFKGVVCIFFWCLFCKTGNGFFCMSFQVLVGV